MLFLLSGAPAIFGFFGFNTVRAIAEAKFAKVDIARTHSLESLYEAFQNRQGDAFVVQVLFQDERVAQLMRRTQTKLVIFDSSLTDIFCFGMRNEHTKFPIALRLATLSIASQVLMSDVASVVRYERPTPESRLLSLIQSLVLFYGLEPEPELIEKVAKALSVDSLTSRTTVEEGMSANFPGRISSETVLSRLSHEQRTIVARLDEAYGQLIASGGTKTIAWPVEALSLLDTQEVVQAPFPLVGPARTLVSGPNLHLPAGRWLMEIVFGIEENGSGNRLKIEVKEARRPRGKQEIDLPKRGRLAVTIAFEVEETKHAVGIEIATMEGAIEGMLSVESMRLRRIGAPVLQPATEA
ncbi:hypothetical protein [Aurantimonas sp. 22II-16-19i]|uniref:hypothetical protein n=1 Tax=Aurantimonas sp. 22II-16-19i TaxID=1317114 RepID=UPI0009F7D7EA|nr:hypothetical protein [Aurantimonas sp. 22II-16-19i]ORE92350.1 hypothetical protein ATO4_17552 [Aurantimonas sp. 22II-16-19i]